MELTTILTILLTPFCSVVSWVVARRARNNDMLVKMQETIDMLVAKNQELYIEVISLRDKLAQYGID